ncbi:DUF3772 domain-containing protein [Yoonia sediminilitoris]|uniref:Small-conductance mechanosensitive channel n=1 Tax=Yoonia sediminilitoris TaxID=1286148 RepID=A0A2T6K9D2_9RHOB|nr:DUF3772 domain-containing protein [Yoonia sediminilitoris]PUB11316.1 small-conductance mechanosensitive channel [Yoonia sediminilitoris]RCW91132.1 small-conductance mechanosensitive channel [Yoonia sediminilitoris]
MINRLFVLLAVVIWPLSAMGQSLYYPDLEAELQPALVAQEGVTDWEDIAQRAEEVARDGDASAFAIARLRAQLVVWRDVFLDNTSQNAERIATVESQIAALGPEPESGDEPAAIAERRAALQDQLDTLSIPGVLAEEAFARANGLIRELDGQVIERQTRELTALEPSPLNPTSIADGTTALWATVTDLGAEIRAGLSAQWESGRLLRNLPAVLFYLGLAIGLVVYARRWLTVWRARMLDNQSSLQPIWLLLLSLSQMIVPVIGIYSLTRGLETLQIFGLRGQAVIDALPLAGFIIVFVWWLSGHIFPAGENAGTLGYDLDTRDGGRRYALAIGWVIALGSVVDAAIKATNTELSDALPFEWTVLALLGFLLWRLGRYIKRPPAPVEGHDVSPGRMRSLVGRFCTFAAIVAPSLAAIGYVNAGRSLIVPTILSLALFGFVNVLQRITEGVTSAVSDGKEESPIRALAPVLVSMALYLVSLPILALIWGARVDDLFEVWSRFREGFAFGDSRISPTDFLTFALVFGLGYAMTRFIQGTLRRSVLPRTRLDLGGQNAIVSGLGYLGIILAAIVAITSAGIDLSNLAIVAGALSVGIGFGLQNIVSNFVSGIILLIERPVSEGDWIEVGGHMGYVRGISVRSTRIETFDRTDVIIPNADLVSGQVINWTRGNLVGRVIVPVGVAYGSDVDQVIGILQEIAEKHPMVIMDPPPSVLFMGFGADSLDFEIRAILRDVNYVMVTKSEMNHEISLKFAAAGIEIPFAQRDIWLRNPEVLNKGEA